MDESPGHTQLYAEVGRLTMTSASIDNDLTLLLARLMSRTQQKFDYGLPSVFMFTARSIEQRFEMLRKVFRLRCAPMFEEKRNTKIRRAVEFTEKAMNVALANIQAHRWIRNTAAHGTFLKNQSDVRLVPAILDIEGQTALAARGKEFEDGLTLAHLEAATAQAMFDHKCLANLNHVFWSLLEWKQDPSEFLSRANELARDLKLSKISLKDPREGPPMRQRKQKKGGSPPTR